jgi:peptidoglycan/LPS O-acetylase OafA/YrhL
MSGSNRVLLERDRIDALDAWRAISIISVMAFHYLVCFAPPLFDTATYGDIYGFRRSYPFQLEFGKFGVLVFFVISGMVITMTLLRSRDALDFAFKRFSRLYPAYLACMTFTFVFVAFFGLQGWRVSLLDYVGNLTMLAYRMRMKMVDPAYWSLAIEIEFYFYIALAWLALKRSFWIGVIILGLIGIPASIFNEKAADAIFLAQYMPFFLGGMAAWFALRENRMREASWLALAAIIIYAFRWKSITLLNNPSLFAAIGLFLCCALLIASVAFNVSHPILAYIGRRSYSLYLIHQNVGLSIIHQLTSRTHELIAIAAACAASFALAEVSYRLMEQRCGNFLRTHWKKLRPRLTALTFRITESLRELIARQFRRVTKSPR